MNKILAAAIPFSFILIAFLSIYYIASRLREYFGLRSKWILVLLITANVIASVFFITIAVRSANPLVGMISVAAGYLLLYVFYLLVAVAVVHVITPLIKQPRKRLGWLALGLALGPVLIGAMQALTFEVNETSIAISGLNKKMEIMLITDVHIGHHRGKEYLRKIVEQTNASKPDMVLITGDLMDSEAALSQDIMQPLENFKAPAFYVGGNHEREINEQKAMELVAANGVRVLHNEIIDTLGLQLIGLDYMKADENTFDMHPSSKKETIQSTLQAMHIQKGETTLMMHHSPIGSSYAALAGVDLYVAGHTHAGQIFPFTWLAKLIFGLNRGLYRDKGTNIFVSQGAGTFMSRMRLGSQNEINLLHLIPSDK